MDMKLIWSLPQDFGEETEARHVVLEYVKSHWKKNVTLPAFALQERFYLLDSDPDVFGVPRAVCHMYLTQWNNHFSNFLAILCYGANWTKGSTTHL